MESTTISCNLSNKMEIPSLLIYRGDSFMTLEQDLMVQYIEPVWRKRMIDTLYRISKIRVG